MHILIKQVIGVHCITQSDGQKIFDSIHKSLKKSDLVILDFHEVIHFASPFFATAIGQLLKDIAEPKLRQSLVIDNVSPVGMLIIENIIKNAVKYYNDNKYQNAVDSVLNEQINMATI